MTRSVATACREIRRAARMLRSRRGMEPALLGYLRMGMFGSTGIMLVESDVIVTRTRPAGASLIPGVYGRFIVKMPLPPCDHSDPISVSDAMLAMVRELPVDMIDPEAHGLDGDETTAELDAIARAWTMISQHTQCHFVTGPIGAVRGSGIVFVPGVVESYYDRLPPVLDDPLGRTTRAVRIKRSESVDVDEIGPRRILDITLDPPQGCADQTTNPMDRLRVASALPTHLQDLLK